MYQGSNLIMKASCVAICKNIRLGVGLTNCQTAFYFYKLFICANQQDGRTRFDYGYEHEYDYEIFNSQIRIRLRFGSTAFLRHIWVETCRTLYRTL